MPESPHTPETLRLFIALPFPDPIAADLALLQERLRKGVHFTACRPRWTQPGTMHLTLAFLGDQPASLAPEIARILATLTAGFAPQRLELKQFGVFPHWKRPAVLWVGVRDRTRQLAPLHAALGEALRPFGISPHAHTFQPHVTLARFKNYKDIAAVERLVRNQPPFRFGPFLANHLTLFSSTLTPDGPEHQVVSEAPFAPPAAGENDDSPA